MSGSGGGDPAPPLWHGRLGGSAADVLWRFTVDHTDRRLLAVDVEGSRAHAAMLSAVGIIDGSEAKALDDGLRRIAEEAASGTFRWLAGDEDVHSAVERRLGEIAGEVAGKLHTGRSRNDQVALDLRLYLRRAATDRIAQVASLCTALGDAAEATADVVVATYTHLQQAQPASLGHHLLAHAWALLRDVDRLADCARRLDTSPLGAGAVAGSSLPLQPELTAAALGMSEVFTNSMDAVASRDLAAEYVFCCTQAAVTLSRLAEDVVLWASQEFAWAAIPDALATGSSALPQKKNPDIAELVRGRAAAVIGDLVAVLALQKGLPMAYNRDLQEDKRAVFHADDTLSGAVEAMTALVGGLRFDPPPPGPWVVALDLAEALVERGVPFREAHRAVGSLVARLVDESRTLADVDGDDLVAAHDRFTRDDVALVDPSASLARRRSPGSGAPESVRKQLGELRSRLAALAGQAAT